MRRWLMTAALLMLPGATLAQGILGMPAPSAGKGHVSYAAEVTEVAAGKPVVIELRFHVDAGFHVNSHTPSSELLIATALKLDPAANVKVLEQEYPKGAPFRIGTDTLDVYQGEFRVRLKVVAPKGASTLSGTLRYQACDNAACYPPKNLPVSVTITGK